MKEAPRPPSGSPIIGGWGASYAVSGTFAAKMPANAERTE